MLLELADYFGVSLDSLMGHQVAADRVEEKLALMESQTKAGDYDAATATARMLLRNYPNEVRVLERCADIFYQLFVYTDQRSYMEESIELTRRLMALDTDSTGAKRLEYLSQLANQYELLNDWEKAEKYYKEGNVGNMNDRALARCLANAGKDQEALEALSKIYCNGMLKTLGDVNLMARMWEHLGQPSKAEAVLKWGCAALEAMDDEVATSLRILAVAIYVQLAGMMEEQGRTAEADEYVRLAVRADCGKEKGIPNIHFISPGQCRELISNARASGGELVMQILSGGNAGRLLNVAKEAMNE